MKTKRFISTLIYVVIIVSILNACGDKKDSKNDDSSENNNDFSKGEIIYKSHCAVCHQIDGKGIQGAFPGLIGKQAQLNTVVNGREGTIMRAFKHELTDIQIADVVNFVNHAWGNKFTSIKPDSVSLIK